VKFPVYGHYEYGLLWKRKPTRSNMLVFKRWERLPEFKSRQGHGKEASMTGVQIGSTDNR